MLQQKKFLFSQATSIAQVDCWFQYSVTKQLFSSQDNDYPIQVI